MMESLGLYEDLSLFQGDLLIGVDPLANELPNLGPDGSCPELTKFYPTVDLFTAAPTVYQQPLDNANDDDDWMEKKMDLIKWFSGPNVQVTIQEPAPFAGIDLSPYLQSKPNPHLLFDPYQPTETGVQISPEGLQNVVDLLSIDLVDSSPTAPTASFSGFGDEVGDFSTDGLSSLLTEEEFIALNAPILSPVSPQDVESILSSEPTSPVSLSSVNDFVIPEFQTINLQVLDSTDSKQPNFSAIQPDIQLEAGPIRPVRSGRGKKYKPYDPDEATFEKPTKKSSRGHRVSDKKERKKQQNKDAALRYRLKRKDEQNTVFDECDGLEQTNLELTDRVDGMTREIQYLKDLLLEVYKAKGLKPSPALLSSK